MRSPGPRFSSAEESSRGSLGRSGNCAVFPVQIAWGCDGGDRASSHHAISAPALLMQATTFVCSHPARRPRNCVKFSSHLPADSRRASPASRASFDWRISQTPSRSSIVNHGPIVSLACGSPWRSSTPDAEASWPVGAQSSWKKKQMQFEDPSRDRN